MRLNRYIAQSGVTSRRKADELIKAGRVQINGKIVTVFGIKVEAGDKVEVDGERISVPDEKLVIALNKPRGVTTTLDDPHAEKTVVDLLPKNLPRLNPVGRLDKDSEGLLLLTNDGDLLNELTHPKFEHEKEYIVVVEDFIHDDRLEKLKRGVMLAEGNTGSTEVKRLNKNKFSIVLHQGWKRQIRRMVEVVGNRVTMLQRVRIGKLQLGNLKPGQIRTINRSDIL